MDKLPPRSGVSVQVRPPMSLSVEGSSLSSVHNLSTVEGPRFTGPGVSSTGQGNLWITLWITQYRNSPVSELRRPGTPAWGVWPIYEGIKISWAFLPFTMRQKDYGLFFILSGAGYDGNLFYGKTQKGPTPFGVEPFLLYWSHNTNTVTHTTLGNDEIRFTTIGRLHQEL